MSNAPADEDFAAVYMRTKQRLGVLYHEGEFRYPHNGPWPERSFDYPYGQAPEVLNIPADEQKDWDLHVGQYYKDNALGSLHTGLSPFGIQAAEFAAACMARNGLRAYDDIDDGQFAELLCEGLYSKFLEPLTDADRDQFAVDIIDTDHYAYYKSDYRCMRVVKDTWPGEYAAPSIALVRRPKDESRRYDWEAVAIALSHKGDDGDYVPVRKAPIFRPKDPNWWLARYYVLQGAIHRINLIDHVKVHFPSDAVNAITKTVLPRWHLVYKFLLPHFRLTLPVNYAVLEGQRSLINRDTWYPWSPFAAKGSEVRRLLPFAWAGAAFYDMDDTDSFPPFRFSLSPDTMPDPDDPAHATRPTYIGLGLSRYGAFQRDYYEPVLALAKQVVAQLPPPPADPAAHDDLAWLEIQHWAAECAKFMPGFPDWRAICDSETLARVLAYLVWNAAVVHTSDHATLHRMMDQRPVPFVLRTPPPKDPDTPVRTEVGKVLPAGVGTALNHLLERLEGDTGPVEAFAEWLEREKDGVVKSHSLVELAGPADLTYAKMADLLFYLPHNTTLLYDCDYGFQADDSAMVPEGQHRPLLGAARKQALAAAIDAFKRDLDAVDASHQEAINRFGFPKLRPDPGLDPASAEYRRQAQQQCMGAGIQY
ncbi:MAG: hypothetical protein K9L70_04550 [Thiohalocapsa sp.]|nr:hypothetical protein [Thiohalocapsa sp.]MCF7991368.1 hypothetical protein [Thiohalocapsa sp.]